MQRVGADNYFIRTAVLAEAGADGVSEREIIERDLEKFLGLDRERVEFESVSPSWPRKPSASPFMHWPRRRCSSCYMCGTPSAASPKPTATA